MVTFNFEKMWTEEQQNSQDMSEKAENSPYKPSEMYHLEQKIPGQHHQQKYIGKTST